MQERLTQNISRAMVPKSEKKIKGGAYVRTSPKKKQAVMRNTPYTTEDLCLPRELFLGVLNVSKFARTEYLGRDLGRRPVGSRHLGWHTLQR